MSASKDLFLKIEAQQCSLWIYQQYGVRVTPESDAVLWSGLYSDYIAMLDAEQAEYQWRERHSHNQFFHELSADLKTASSLLTLLGSATQTSASQPTAA